VINFGGIDSFKAESYEYDEALQQARLGSCAVDMPGVGESPIKGSTTAGSLFSAVIDYLEKRPEVDPKRIGIQGRSFGGYWASKMAYVECNRLRGVVNWGAGVHRTFQEEWLRPALTKTASQYLLGPASLFEARAYMFRAKTLEEVLRLATKLSLKDQGWLEKPNAPLLLVNGKKDDQHPIEDFYLLLDYGDPKEVRIYPEAGHMGRQPGKPSHEVLDMITRWIKQKLS